MKISVITVSFNAAKTIRDTIESVLSQEGIEELEYIIVDGGSADDTIKIVNEYKDRIAHIISEPDKGIYDGMNKGIATATGDIVGILNADDLYANKHVLANVAKGFSDEVEATYGNLVYVDANDTNQIKRTWIAKPYKEGAFLRGWMPPHPTFFVRKSIYEKFGLYTLKLKSAADYEMMLRLIHKEKINLKYINSTLVHMRIGGVSNASLKNRIKANKEDRLAWKMNDLKPLPTTFIRKPLSKIGQFFKR